MTVKDLLGCYVETMNKDTVRIYVSRRAGNNELVYQDHICDLKEEFGSLEVFHWFATLLKNEIADTEITIFVKEADYKRLNYKEEGIVFGDEWAKNINLVDSLRGVQEVPFDVLNKYGTLAKYISIINYLKDRGTL